MNVVAISGRLTRDPEIRRAGETEVASFSIAVNGRYKNKDTGAYDVNYFAVNAFGGVGKFVEQYFSKGMKVEIQGNLRQERWTDKEGNKRERYSIIAEKVDFGESKKAASENGVHEKKTSSGSKSRPVPAPSPDDDDSFMDVDITEDLPF